MSLSEEVEAMRQRDLSDATARRWAGHYGSIGVLRLPTGGLRRLIDEAIQIEKNWREGYVLRGPDGALVLCAASQGGAVQRALRRRRLANYGKRVGYVDLAYSSSWAEESIFFAITNDGYLRASWAASSDDAKLDLARKAFTLRLSRQG